VVGWIWPDEYANRCTLNRSNSSPATPHNRIAAEDGSGTSVGGVPVEMIGGGDPVEIIGGDGPM
jgi:hypothetical protein